MMKTGKKLVGLMLCFTLTAGCLFGCGGTSANDEEILTSAVKSINEAKNFDMVGKTSGKMVMKMGGQSQEMDMSSEVKGTQFADPLKAKVTGVTKTAGTSVETESYVQKEDDKYVVYVKAAGTWSKMVLGDLDQAISASGMNSIEKQLKEDVSKYTKKDDREVDGKDYLVYEYTVSGEEIKEMMAGVSSSLGAIMGGQSGDMEQLLNDMVKDIGDMPMTILFDRESKSIYQIEYSMTEMMNKMMKSVMESISKMSGEDAGQGLSDLSIEVSDMNMVITYSNIGSAADFEIPEEALSAKEMDLGDAQEESKE